MNRKKALYLQKEIAKNIKLFELRKNRHKKRSFHLNLLTVVCTASITTILGLKDINVGSLFINISIVLGGVVTILHFIDGFYNYKDLWVKDGKAYTDLLELQRDLTFYMEGRGANAYDMEALEEFKVRLNEIINISTDEWHKLHQKKDGAEEDM
ncbi:Uncharacterised protein [Bacillus freudenreichii]|nr:Uncharacterised protein [Bacillus freudenreichii]